VRLVHELEELGDHLQYELPVGAQEPRVLPDDVHDVGGDHRLNGIILILLFISSPTSDDEHDESLLVIF
ncbi:hypothetical protein PMAYCL1PPCAC_32356, partial [Pristionchus mayeri]